MRIKYDVVKWDGPNMTEAFWKTCPSFMTNVAMQQSVRALFAHSPKMDLHEAFSINGEPLKDLVSLHNTRGLECEDVEWYIAHFLSCQEIVWEYPEKIKTLPCDTEERNKVLGLVHLLPCEKLRELVHLPEGVAVPVVCRIVDDVWSFVGDCLIKDLFLSVPNADAQVDELRLQHKCRGYDWPVQDYLKMSGYYAEPIRKFLR